MHYRGKAEEKRNPTTGTRKKTPLNVWVPIYDIISDVYRYEHIVIVVVVVVHDMNKSVVVGEGGGGR